MFGKFSIIKDEEGPQLALISPSPIVVFDDIGELRRWLEELTVLLDELENESVKSSSKPLKATYAVQVIKEWQNLLQKTQKNNGTER